jgi:mRNA interferase RelE/StbE
MITMYTIELMPKAIKDLKSLPKADIQKILEKIKTLENGLIGDIKKLTDFTPEYRLRVGNYRILFETKEQKITIYRIKHRKDAYL